MIRRHESRTLLEWLCSCALIFSFLQFANLPLRAQVQQASGSIPATAPAAGNVPGSAGPLLPGYHTRFSDEQNAPNIAPAGGDPWALARRLGVADNGSYPIPENLRNVDLLRQSAEAAAAKSFSCIQCHTDVGHMHPLNSIDIGCTDCHGGDATRLELEKAHVPANFPPAWKGGGNPVRSYTILNHESPEFVRFMNPGDARVAHIACGQCHAKEVLQLRTSMMTHGCMLWGAALYNNGAVAGKYPRYGESYSMHGVPQRLVSVPQPTADETRDKGVLPFLEPLPMFQISQPGNVLRIFERGGRFRPEVGIPERLEEPGRPRERLSNRGLGTENRTDPVFIGLQKTRLLDPTLNFLGTNDHPGDYRSSGCSACHVLYANDRDPIASDFLAKYGNRGLAAAEKDDWVQFVDPMISKTQSGHPIQHKFELRLPTSQCMVCHVHPGTNVLNSYLGYMWWDNETDGELMYPRHERQITAQEYMARTMSNPEEAAVRGHWGDPEFLANVRDLNPHLQHTQFADFHGHGWVYRAVYKKDRQGNLLDWRGAPVGEVTNQKLQQAMLPPTHQEKLEGKQRDGAPVHMMDIHMERGMHCADCHFYQDSHGNTKLYGEVRAAIEIQCIDCHGGPTESLVDKVEQQLARGQAPRLGTSGPASESDGTNLLALRTTFGQPQFEIIREPGKQPKLIQRSSVDKDLWWQVTQTADTVRPCSDDYNPRSHAAKSSRLGPDGKVVWGGIEPQDFELCPHNDSNMSCISCHSSWNPSCFGCHLPQKANIKSPDLHNFGEVTSKNRTSYNFQTLRDDVFMLAHDGNVTGNRIGPARSSCAIHVTSYNANRESIYAQQQTISTDGLSGIAFSTNVPHTVRGGPGMANEAHAGRPGSFETKSCTDCHLSAANDNNAIMAQLTMQGTGFTNFIGKYCYVAAGEHGFEAVVVTESEEPQAVIGSSLHATAYPDRYREHVEHRRELEHAHEHPGRDIIETLSFKYRQPEVLDLQHRGEYIYAACGEGGLRVFDIAFIDHKAFAERITTAPVSPLGQRFYVRTEYAQAVAAPTTIAPDPTRNQDPKNEEPAVHPMYAYIYVADKYEGLILVGAGTLLDGNPLNNFLERATTFNPDGLLCGARAIKFVGTYAYVCCDQGLVVVDLDDPLHPKITSIVDDHQLHHAHAVDAQFRYAFVTDEHGVLVLDITEPAYPRPVQHVPLDDAHAIYVARTYAYVAAGKHGLVILDVTNPESTFVDQIYSANGKINDTHDVQLGITNVSQFAYLADGKNGLQVVQLTGPNLPGNDGFSPRPAPYLVANYTLPKGGHALAISRGMDRDRAVDESGHQLSVFGRIGAKPLEKQEVFRMFRRPDGGLWWTSDDIFDPRLYNVLAPARRKQ